MVQVINECVRYTTVGCAQQYIEEILIHTNFNFEIWRIDPKEELFHFLPLMRGSTAFRHV
jgi:hypothetical protein